MGNAIFEDLEIDHSDMLSDPLSFSERVHEAADQLRAICKSDTSVAAFTEKYKSESKEIPEDLSTLFNKIYEDVDQLDLHFIVDAIVQAKKLVADLETAFRDRCIYKAAEEGKATGNKRVAHAQYTRLRDDYNLYVRSLNVLMANKGYELKLLPNLPGNYGSGNSQLVNYVFEINGEQFRNHHVVCRKIGIELRSLMDLLEYLEENDTEVIVKEVS